MGRLRRCDLATPALPFCIKVSNASVDLPETMVITTSLSLRDRDANIFDVALVGNFDDDIFYVWYGYGILPVFRKVSIGVGESKGGGDEICAQSNNLANHQIFK